MNYNNINDYELMYLIKENDPDAYDLAYKKYKPLLDFYVYKSLNYARRFGLDYDDLFQESLIGLYRALENYDTANNALLYTFVIICVRGQIYNIIRQASTAKYHALNSSISMSLSINENGLLEDVIEGIALNPVDLMIEGQLQDILIVFKHSIDPINSQVLEMKINGFSGPEIGILLDLPTKTVNNLIYASRKKLVMYLKKQNYI
ncbi:MAG: sigma-70 family RNA polymerase sigma factor [Bacilli bacterium]